MTQHASSNNADPSISQSASCSYVPLTSVSHYEAHHIGRVTDRRLVIWRAGR
jgi:hypothetical protein